ILKPDGIGDFVLASGALRLLARECGEENLILVVKSLLVPLARSQFPRATVIDLPVAAERKVINLFAWNFMVCLPVWWRLRTTRVDAAVCLRSMRNYLETFLFLSSQAGRRVASENILLRGKRKVRTVVETTANRFFRTELVDYPETAEQMPMEIESHRRVMTRLLKREVAESEVLPVLQATASSGGDYWICAPVTNLKSKLYPPAKWGEIFRGLQPEAAGKRILLAGSEDQRASLEELLGVLRENGCTQAEIVFPSDLVEYVNLIAGTEVMLTVDTAAAHFATALDRPTLVLFSGLHRGMFGPWRRSERQSWLSPAIAEDRKKKKWHAGLAPERAAAEVRALLGLRPDPAPVSMPRPG
ncbi:MAG: glycosyltransferase family 9 protein, partial [Terrimicrobiaceae bacterium]